MMDAFIKATTFQYSAFLMTGNGDVWRLWFGPDGPLMERSVPEQVPLEVVKEFADAR